MGKRLHGLYAITGDSTGEALRKQVTEALEGGIALLQYRDKSRDSSVRKEEAQALLALCRSSGVPLIINDDIELAAAVGADGVHLGRDDGSIETARRLLGPKAIIGSSCYNDFELAVDAQRRGADYVAFGRFFPSTTKPQAIQADEQLLRRGKQELGVPMVAIGGITPENGAALVAAGAAMLAVVDALFGQPDITRACASFHRHFRDNLEDPPR
ncbi:MAG: thiamine phosphate synthase [Gammaproteobacteria bacterium]|nr:thiamine phosphate synthase [Gammaproteobacteria bacterium]